jgi:thiamine pyrophosphate-dependent acetolactate synthase large subunit-like protein
VQATEPTPAAARVDARPRDGAPHNVTAVLVALLERAGVEVLFGYPGGAIVATSGPGTATDLPRVVHEAFAIAREGRPGPVLIDLPKDGTHARGPRCARRPVSA